MQKHEDEMEPGYVHGIYGITVWFKVIAANGTEF